MSSSAPDGHLPGPPTPACHPLLQPEQPEPNTHRRQPTTGACSRQGVSGTLKKLRGGAERHFLRCAPTPTIAKDTGGRQRGQMVRKADLRGGGPGVGEGEVGGWPPPRADGPRSRGEAGPWLTEGRRCAVAVGGSGGGCAVTGCSGAAARPGTRLGRARRPQTPRRAATRCTCAPGPRRRPRPPPRTPRRRTCAGR